MSRKKTQKEFEEEVINATNGEYVVIGEYVTNRTKIKIKHLKCGTEFEVAPKDFLEGKSRCPIQGKENIRTAQLKSKEQFQKDFDNRSIGEYTLLSEYINTRTKIEVKHNSCGKTFKVTPNNFISKNSTCPHCSKNQRKNTEIFKEEVFQLEENEYKVLGEYKGKNLKIEFYHEECGRSFLMAPDKFIQGHRCTACTETKGEAKVRKALQKYNIEFAKQYSFSDCKGKKYPLKFDFAIFKNKKLVALLEYDGEQHFKPKNFHGISNEKAIIAHEKTVNRDKIKNYYCRNNNITLIRIPYWEYDNIEKIIISNMAIPSEAIEETHRTCND